MGDMALRLVLSLAMCIPAGPAPREIQCPFATMEECRAWLEQRCGDDDRLIEACMARCQDAMSPGEDDVDSVDVVTCCSATPSGEIPAEKSTPTSCCSATLEVETPSCSEASSTGCCGEDEAAEQPEPDVASYCPDHSAAGAKPLTCDWCCCCPVRPIRVPVPPQPAPAAQRSSLEKVHTTQAIADYSTAAASIHSAPFAGKLTPVPLTASSRQSVLCVWRE